MLPANTSHVVFIDGLQPDAIEAVRKLPYVHTIICCQMTNSLRESNYIKQFNCITQKSNSNALLLAFHITALNFAVPTTIPFVIVSDKLDEITEQVALSRFAVQVNAKTVSSVIEMTSNKVYIVMNGTIYHRNLQCEILKTCSLESIYAYPRSRFPPGKTMQILRIRR